MKIEPDVEVSAPLSIEREVAKKKNPSGLRESCPPLRLSLKLFPPLKMLFLLAPTHSLTLGLPSCCACLGLSTHLILFHDLGLTSPPDSEYHMGRPWPS